MHHVCGEHEWNEGQCSHGPLTEMEGGKEYLEMDSKAAKELKKILVDREWSSMSFSGTVVTGIWYSIYFCVIVVTITLTPS